MRVLLALFIVIPILEMWLLIEVGSRIGALLTIFLVFATAAIGLLLLRQQGVSTLMQLNSRIEHGQLPLMQILEGVALAVGGALLLTPGFITDGFGFMCLIPVTRKFLISGLLRRGLIRTARYNPHAASQQQAHFTSFDHIDRHSTNSTTLDGEYRRED